MENDSRERTLCRSLWNVSLQYTESAGFPQDPFNLTLIWSSLIYSVHDILEANNVFQNIAKEYIFTVSEVFNVPSHEVEVLAEFSKFQRRIYRTISNHDLNPITKAGAKKILELSVDIRFPDGAPDDVAPTILDIADLSLAAADAIKLCTVLYSRKTHIEVRQPVSNPEQAQTKNVPDSTQKEGKGLLLLFGVCMAIFLLLASLFWNNTQGKVTSNSPAATSAPTLAPATDSKIPRPSHGRIFKRPRGKQLAPLTIVSDMASPYDYFFCLKSATDPENNMTFYVRRGNDLEILVPLDTYEIYYAYGDAWRGTSDLFGDNTFCQVFDETFTFSQDEEGYLGWTVTMKASTGGNLDSEYIDLNEFPH